MRVKERYAHGERHVCHFARVRADICGECAMLRAIFVSYLLIYIAHYAPPYFVLFYLEFTVSFYTMPLRHITPSKDRCFPLIIAHYDAHAACLLIP